MPLPTASTTRLEQLVGGQLQGLSAAARLPHATADRLRAVFTVLTRESLDRPCADGYPGLSAINANGLPFQWSACFGARKAPPTVRFLCESGTPGTAARERLALSLDRLGQACRLVGLSGVPRWYTDQVLARLLPCDEDWPAHWRSALWTGVGAADQTIALKPYVNLCRGAPLERWRRVGWVLKSLGRDRALERLCDLSSQVSRDSWPVGLAVDITPTGEPGRVKTYFRSGPVTAAWLQRWYTAVGAHAHFPALRELLDVFPHPDRATYPGDSFVLTLEAHPTDGVLTLKTDLAATRWMTGDAAIARGAARLLSRLGLDPGGLDGTLAALGAPPLTEDRSDVLRFVGFGYEPDGSHHVNVYLEPPVPEPAPWPHRRHTPVGHRPAPADVAAAVKRGLRWLTGAQQDGHWIDYTLPVGTADAWVTAYVLTQLSGIPAAYRDEPGHAAADAALAWLRAARTPDGGWGYNRTCDDDADSTGLAVQALRSHGLPVPPDALDLLRRCRHTGGGIATYPPYSTPGAAWSTPIGDVTPTAVDAIGEGQPQAAAWLLGQRSENGLWRPYWWLTPLYPTASALDLLAGLSNPYTRGQTLDPTREAMRRYVPDGAFETALLLRCRLALRIKDTHEPLKRLLDRQNHDGSWPASAYLRLTTPTVYEPWNTVDAGTVYLDQQRILTTATVIKALAALLLTRRLPWPPAQDDQARITACQNI
ncbi:hypothetical protein AB0F25_25515 [Streptomyces wedmorensis]|uniref:hypothetical protein n=1 Tax=Streptomyces wedmorensis TaxID=43759 RepID=UPI00342F91A9